MKKESYEVLRNINNSKNQGLNTDVYDIQDFKSRNEKARSSTYAKFQLKEPETAVKVEIRVEDEKESQPFTQN